MTPFNSVILLIFGILGYIIIVDENVSIYVNLVFKIIKVNVERLFWMIKFHPKNPITNLIKRWEYAKIAKELQKEFDDTLRQTD
jgi:hypothetical protein